MWNLFYETWKYILIFYHILNAEMVQVVESSPHGGQGSVY